MSVLLWCVAFADPVIDGLEAELARSMEQLALEGAERPYYLSYRLLDQEVVSASGSLGALVYEHQGPRRELGIELRVGSASDDNLNFRTDRWSRGGGLERETLCIDDLETAIRHTAWLGTDEAYKDALERLAKKRAADRRRAKADELLDHGPAEPTIARLGRASLGDASQIVALAEQGSARFTAYPWIDVSGVQTLARAGREVVLTSEGTVVEQPSSIAKVSLLARTRADDGAAVVDQTVWLTDEIGDLPSVDALHAELDAMAERLRRWRDAEILDDEYVGPVLFEQDAAVDLFRYLLLPGLEGTPAPDEPSSGSRVVVFGGSEPGASAPMRLQRRALPPGWTVVDDPTVDLPGGFAYDAEGVPAQRVTLIDNGIVRTHLSSRTPSESVPVSNGHARGTLGKLARGMATVTTVDADRTSSSRKLHKKAIALAADYGRDHYLVVRRLEDPSVAYAGVGPLVEFGSGEGGGLPAPLVLVRVDAEGQEELLRGAAFGDVSERLLRDIVAAGEARTRTLAEAPPMTGNHAGPMGLPVTLTAPDVLVAEVEVVPSPVDVERPPQLPSPLAER